MNRVSHRTVYIAAIDRHVSLWNYVNAIKKAKANPEAEFKHGLTCWWPCTGAEIMKQFFDGVQDRINQGIPYMKRGKEATQ